MSLKNIEMVANRNFLTFCRPNHSRAGYLQKHNKIYCNNDNVTTNYFILVIYFLFLDDDSSYVTMNTIIHAFIFSWHGGGVNGCVSLHDGGCRNKITTRNQSVMIVKWNWCDKNLLRADICVCVMPSTTTTGTQRASGAGTHPFSMWGASSYYSLPRGAHNNNT